VNEHQTCAVLAAPLDAAMAAGLFGLPVGVRLWLHLGAGAKLLRQAQAPKADNMLINTVQNFNPNSTNVWEQRLFTGLSIVLTLFIVQK
jgi:hypothetical protein